MRAAPAIDRIFALSRCEDRGYPSPCRIFTGYLDDRGYGRITRDLDAPSNTVLVHKIVWEYTYQRAVPIGLELDHLCRQHDCNALEHLEPVPHAVNVLRGNSPSAGNARKTHCKHGHEFTPENTYLKKSHRPNSGLTRRCQICRRANRIRNRTAPRTEAQSGPTTANKQESP